MDAPATERPNSLWWPLALYALFALASTWPVAISLTTALPQGTEEVATVPLFNAWTVWWNADRATHGLAGYWDAPVFHPTDGTFAFSEPQPTTLAVAPLVWLSGTPVAAYNVYILAALTLNGWSAYRLLRYLDLALLPALFGGALLELLPFVHWQFGVLQLVPLFGVIWTLHALVRFGDAPNFGRGAVLGIAFAATYLLCNYYGLFLSVLLLLGGPCLVGRQFLDWRTWVALTLGGTLSAALVAPLVVPQLRVSRQHTWTRELALIESLSAQPGDYTASPPGAVRHLPHFTNAHRARWWTLSPGYVKLALAVLGSVAGLFVPRRRWFAMCLLTILAAAFLFSLGPTAEWRFLSPYRWLMWYYPGFAQIRSPFRFAVFAQLAVALLAGFGVQLVWQCGMRQCGTPLRGVNSPTRSVGPLWRNVRAITALAALLLATAAAVELWPKPQRLVEVPSLADNRGWIDWLRTNTDSKTPIACIPFPAGREVGDYEQTAVWMYCGCFHGRPLVNGYSGFFPQTFLDLKDDVTHFPDQTSLDELQHAGVRHVVVRRASHSREDIARHLIAGKRLDWQHGDDRAGIDVYELRPRL